MNPAQRANMFDDKKQPAEDMFSSTENDSVPAKPASPLLTPPPIAAAAVAPPSALPDAPHHSGFGFVKIVLVVVVVLVLVAGAAYAAYQVMVRKPTDAGIVNSVSDEGVVATDNTKIEENDILVEPDPKVEDEKPVNKGTFLDSDGDGLTNAEELDAGTLSNNPDSDNDGLGDREEVEVYETDPREADTDSDGFLDGQEVAGGYNPNGDGRLFNVPSP